MKFIFGIQINIEVFYKLLLSFWVCVARHAQSTQNKLQSRKICNPSLQSRKTWWMKLIFCLQINTKVCYKLIISLWLCVVRYAQSAEINKLAMSLKYLNFLSADKYQRFLQIYAVILRVCGQTCPNTQNNKFTICDILRKKQVMK